MIENLLMKLSCLIYDNLISMHNVYKQRDHQSVIALSEFNLSQRYYLQVADVTHYKMADFVYL